jgi:hypothetical protein
VIFSGLEVAAESIVRLPVDQSARILKVLGYGREIVTNSKLQ